MILRFDSDVAEDAENYRFHQSQSVHRNADGSLTVKFTAGGIVEMCWHLVTWDTHVEIKEPKRLRKHLAQVCDALAKHHAALTD